MLIFKRDVLYVLYILPYHRRLRSSFMHCDIPVWISCCFGYYCIAIPIWISCCLCCRSYRTILMAVVIELVCIAIYLDGYHVAFVVRPCGGWLDLVTPPTCTGQAVW